MFSAAVLDPYKFNHPPYYRVGRNPPVSRALTVSKMGTHACFSQSALPHANDTSLKHGAWITAPDLESILIVRLIIRATYFLASIEKTFVFNDRDTSRLCGSPGADCNILDSDALLLFEIRQYSNRRVCAL